MEISGDEGKQNIKCFVNIVNKKISDVEDFKKGLNKAVTDALLKYNEYFKSLDEFANFLPKTIKDHLNTKEIKEKLEEPWNNFKIDQMKEQNLEELYRINLDSDTKNKIIEKFKLHRAKSSKLSNAKDVELAFKTCKKILGQDKVSVSDFSSFINDNFNQKSLSSTDMDNIIEYVSSKSLNDKFDGWKFWNVCVTLKNQPSKQFINFMV